MSNSKQNNAWGVPAATGAPPKANAGGKNRPTKKSNSNNNHNNGNGQAKVTTVGQPNLHKFKEAQKAHAAAAQKHFDNYESSSEEELENSSLLDSVFKGYGGDKHQLEKTEKFLEHVFQSGAAICLICIATVKRTEYVSIISTEASFIF